MSSKYSNIKYEKNKAAYKQYAKKYYNKNKKKCNEYSKLYYQKNKAKIKSLHREYNSKHASFIRAYHQKRHRGLKLTKKEYYDNDQPELESKPRQKIVDKIVLNFE